MTLYLTSMGGSSLSTTYKIVVNGWQKHNSKKKKGHPYIMLSTRFFDDHKIAVLTPQQKLAYIYILTRCGDDISSEIRATDKQMRSACGANTLRVQSTLDQLQSNQLLTYDKIEPLKNRIEVKRKEKKRSEVNTSTTEKIQTSEIQTSLNLPQASGPPEQLIKIWNDHCGTLPKAKGLNAQRRKLADARWRENPTSEFWVDVVKKTAESKFCNGKSDSGWRASFDWIIKGDSALKVIEGKYDNNKSPASTAQTRKYDNLDYLEQKYVNGGGTNESHS